MGRTHEGEQSAERRGLPRSEWKRRLATGGSGGDMEGAQGRKATAPVPASIGPLAVIHAARGGVAVEAANPPPWLLCPA